MSSTLAVVMFLLFFGLVAGMMTSLSNKKDLSAEEIDAKGVSIGWWIFWGLMFFPSLTVIAIIHTGRKNRALMRELAAKK